jgi:hypothetical protein
MDSFNWATVPVELIPINIYSMRIKWFGTFSLYSRGSFVLKNEDLAVTKRETIVPVCVLNYLGGSPDACMRKHGTDGGRNPRVHRPFRKAAPHHGESITLNEFLDEFSDEEQPPPQGHDKVVK